MTNIRDIVTSVESSSTINDDDYIYAAVDGKFRKVKKSVLSNYIHGNDIGAEFDKKVGYAEYVNSYLYLYESTSKKIQIGKIHIQEGSTDTITESICKKIIESYGYVAESELTDKLFAKIGYAEYSNSHLCLYESSEKKTQIADININTSPGGNGILSGSITYQTGASNTEKPTGEWSENVQITDVVNKYLWAKITLVFDNGTTLDTYSVSSTVDSIEVGVRNLIRNSKNLYYEDYYYLDDTFKFYAINEEGYVLIDNNNNILLI